MNVTQATTAIVAACVAVSGCQRPPAEPARVAVAEGFQTPESVRYDAAQDVYFVSNINGVPSAKDNNGFISRVTAEGVVDSLRFAAGGRDGATLHAPKGMAILGDTLWVADIDAVRGFHVRTGAPVATIEVRGAVFLNDVAVGPDGALYVTDTGIRIDSSFTITHPGPDRVYAIADRSASIAVEGDTLARPNGITWDAANQQFLIAPFGSPAVFAWRPGAPTPEVLATGPGGYDGIEIVPDGRVLVTSWSDSTVHAYDGDTLKPFIMGLPAPADIGVDTRRNRVAVPLFQDNRVEIWQLP